MAQQPYGALGSSPLSQPHGRMRRSSMEVNPAAAAAFYQQAAALGGGINKDTLTLLFSQNPTGGNGLLQHSAVSAGLAEQPFMESGGEMDMEGSNGYDLHGMEAEEPGPLPCLPRTARGYNNGQALLMQQQLQRSGYGPPGASMAPGRTRQARPRRHSVTIGMLNEHQQASLAGIAGASQFPSAGWQQQQRQATAGMGPARLPMIPQQQQSPPSKDLQNFNMHAAAAQLSIGKQGLGQGLMGAVPPAQQLGQSSLPDGVMSGNQGLGTGLDVPSPAYALNAPRMPGGGGSRRHSWAPMGPESSMAYARSLLLQQQQQRALTAQLGDAGALFVNQQQQDQLGVGGLPMGLRCNGFEGHDSYRDSGLNGQTGLMGPDGLASSSFSGLQGQATGSLGPGLPSLNEALAKEQLAQHLQQQLQQLQLQGYGNGRRGSTHQALDPYAEPFVSRAAMQPLGGFAGLDVNPYGNGLLSQGSAALQQELLQQQQQYAGLGFDADSAGQTAASMYAPLQVNGISVDTQLLVAPYVDNWDVLGQSVNVGSLSGSSVISPGGVMSPSANTGPSAALAGAQMSGYGPRSSRPSQLGPGGGSRNLSSSHSTSSNASAGPAGTNSKGSSTAAANAAGAGASAAVAAASMVASLPPISKVCSDAPWDLKKAADADAKALAAQQAQLERLAAVLECSKTLQKVLAEQNTGADASVKASRPGDASAADTAQALFGYRLPDSGDDTWGAVSEAAGASCISQEPSNKLFVGNIGWWVTEENLLHWFSRFGTVTNVKIMYNSRKMHKPKDKWRSREYGFIDYAAPEEAAKAIVWMDGVELPDLMKDTCGIIVQYAKPSGGQEGSAATAVAV